jgi:hypothetical protein
MNKRGQEQIVQEGSSIYKILFFSIIVIILIAGIIAVAWKFWPSELNLNLSGNNCDINKDGLIDSKEQAICGTATTKTSINNKTNQTKPPINMTKYLLNPYKTKPAGKPASSPNTSPVTGAAVSSSSGMFIWSQLLTSTGASDWQQMPSEWWYYWGDGWVYRFDSQDWIWSDNFDSLFSQNETYWVAGAWWYLYGTGWAWTQELSAQMYVPETANSENGREIISAYVDGKKPITIDSEGDLWMNTWADDGNVYSGWGDGNGTGPSKVWTDFGIARLSGSPSQLSYENIFSDPFPCDNIPGNQSEVNLRCNDKPSSLIFFDKTLYAQLHSPLADPAVGYLAYSLDYGRTWVRYKEQSPWTATTVPGKKSRVGSNFRCMFFINMGQNYELRRDDYVYAFGIGREYSWSGDVYLARVPKDEIMNYSSYEYYSGSTWSQNEGSAVALSGLNATAQFSSIYHAQTGKYIIMTEENIYDAPNPWGPWKLTSRWVKQYWRGYQPGIISKDTGDDYFWFTTAGNPNIPGNLYDVSYKLNIGKIVMNLGP